MSLVRNTRPLTARSVLASVLLGTDPPWLPTTLLVRTAGLFGISEGSTRTALSRMVGSGEAVAEDGGYRLAGRLVARQARQSASRRAETRRWPGDALRHDYERYDQAYRTTLRHWFTTAT
jgi:phenylacetic acid degradation operon negative regulatory protein